jgi:DNA-binding response OmpR family regulator
MIYLLLEADYSLARRLIREIMQLGYEAVWTQHPEDAQRLLRQQPFDLVILSLPVIDQLAQDMLVSLREEGRKTPFAVLLENERPQDRALVLRLGAAICLGKPLAPWSLRNHLRSIIQNIPRRESAEPGAVRPAIANSGSRA